jgi:cbb3-type cytochrome oxidase subunit 3
LEQSSSIESLVQVSVLLILIAGLAYAYWRHRR